MEFGLRFGLGIRIRIVLWVCWGKELTMGSWTCTRGDCEKGEGEGENEEQTETEEGDEHWFQDSDEPWLEMGRGLRVE